MVLRAALPRPALRLVPGVNLQISRISWDLYFDIVAGAAPAAWTNTVDVPAPVPLWLARCPWPWVIMYLTSVY